MGEAGRSAPSGARPGEGRRLGAAGIGPQKTGTTWLDECLRHHPALCLPDRVRETFFLDRRFDRGWDWYWSHFEGCSAGQTPVEVAPTWFDAAGAPGRLHAHNPECRVVATLRDPAERSWSLYLHQRRKGRVGADFRRAAEEIPRIVGASRYAEHLPRWTGRFGRERVHVILLDDAAERPLAVLRGLYRFLGIEPPAEPPDAATERVYPASLPRFPALARWATRVSAWLRDRGHHRLVDAVKDAGGKLAYRGGGARPDLPPELRAELADEFDEDVRYVEELTGRDLEAWRAP